MLDLKGKKALVAGLANKRSIANAAARQLAALGASVAVTYQPFDKKNELERIQKVTDEYHPELLLPMDVTNSESIAKVFETITSKWGSLDILVHAVASAKREELGGRHSDISRQGFLFAQEVSSYSLIEMVRHGRPLMAQSGGSVITMSYIGAERACLNYNVMGVAKASLESNVRYLAMELGPENIRVNAISAGPIRTLSASGVSDFLDMLHNAEEKCALKRNITAEEVAGATVFLASSMSSGITGQVIYVDGGYNVYG